MWLDEFLFFITQPPKPDFLIWKLNKGKILTGAGTTGAIGVYPM